MAAENVLPQPPAVADLKHLHGRERHPEYFSGKQTVPQKINERQSSEEKKSDKVNRISALCSRHIRDARSPA